MKYCTSFFIVFLMLANYCFSQDSTKDTSETSAYYNLFDSFTDNRNKGVFNGKEYVDKFPEFPLSAKKQNKFYGVYNFIKGQIIYNEQSYYNLEMKYDLLNDLIILGFVNKKMNFISLNPELISEFEILGDNFIRLENNSVLQPYYRNGFFKETFKGDTFLLYTKYENEKTPTVVRKKVYYKFNENKFYFLNYKDRFFRINSKRDLIKILPSFERLIKSFFKKSPKLFKKNREQFFANLMRYLELINTEKKNN